MPATCTADPGTVATRTTTPASMQPPPIGYRESTPTRPTTPPHQPRHAHNPRCPPQSPGRKSTANNQGQPRGRSDHRKWALRQTGVPIVVAPLMPMSTSRQVPPRPSAEPGERAVRRLLVEVVLLVPPDVDNRVVGRTHLHVHFACITHDIKPWLLTRRDEGAYAALPKSLLKSLDQLAWSHDVPVLEPSALDELRESTTWPGARTVPLAVAHAPRCSSLY